MGVEKETSVWQTPAQASVGAGVDRPTPLQTCNLAAFASHRFPETMSTEEELAASIKDLGEQVKAAKAAKKDKAEWEPILKEMLAAKVRGFLPDGDSRPLCRSSATPIP